jgi:hypothetical protein
MVRADHTSLRVIQLGFCLDERIPVLEFHAFMNFLQELWFVQDTLL